MKTLSEREKEQFYQDVHEKVDQYLSNHANKGKADNRYYLKVMIILTSFILSYWALVFSDYSLLWKCVSALVLSLSVVAIGFNIMHDGSHRAISTKQWINQLAASTMDLIGGNSYAWKILHVKIHHTHPNVYNVDTDINLNPALYIAPHDSQYRFHGYQQFYAFLLYGIQLFFMNIKHIKVLLKARTNSYIDNHAKLSRFISFIIGKAIYITLAFIIPLQYYSLLDVLIFYFAIVLFMGLVAASVFQVAHLSTPCTFSYKKEPNLYGRWIAQLERTTNFRTMPLFSWFLGGLNFQIEHHLFPSVCHVHYPEISRLVQDVANQHGVPYHQHASFVQALRAHYDFLKKIGKPSHKNTN